ncbi:MAG: hypothetical protein RL701_5053, partial [Pseudomonadota bacterium]
MFQRRVVPNSSVQDVRRESPSVSSRVSRVSTSRAWVAGLVLCMCACREPQAGGERRVADPDASFVEPAPTTCAQLICNSPARCELKDGTPRCACPVGYREAEVTKTEDSKPDTSRPNESALTCQDIDECTTDGADCDENAVCTNLTGSFVCACKQGYTGDGRTCQALDGCRGLTNTCHDDAFCTPAANGVMCKCAQGFEGNGSLCSDIDECERATPDCPEHAKCVNLRGDY